MSVALPDSIQGLDQASELLSQWEAADAAAEAGSDAGAPTRDSQGRFTKPQESAREAAAEDGRTPAQRAGQEGKASPKSEVRSPKSEGEQPPDKSQEQQQQQKPAEQKPEPSRYQKARERQEKSWQELNAQKETLKSEREAIAREREAFGKERQEFESRKADYEKEFSPEAYEDAAKKFEAAGKFDLAELARDKAKELRANPPAKKAEQANAQQDAARKEWALKAGQEFPELVKENSPLQIRVAQILGQEPDLKAHPKGIYLAARLANLEAQASSNAAKDKELETLRAKVKELEGLTAPADAGAATALPATRSYEQLSEEEQFAELQQMAQEVGNLR